MLATSPKLWAPEFIQLWQMRASAAASMGFRALSFDT